MKVICEKYNNCPLGKNNDDNDYCYHYILHYRVDGCTNDFQSSRCGDCISISKLRKLKLEKINGKLQAK